MSQATSANSVVKTYRAGGVIHKGHVVVISGSNVVEAAEHTGFGVYVGEDDCASGDYVPICVLGPCRAWCDATAAIVVGDFVSSDASAHLVVNETSTDRCIGIALEALASGTAFVEILVSPANRPANG